MLKSLFACTSSLLQMCNILRQCSMLCSIILLSLCPLHIIDGSGFQSAEKKKRHRERISGNPISVSTQINHRQHHRPEEHCQVFRFPRERSADCERMVGMIESASGGGGGFLWLCGLPLLTGLFVTLECFQDLCSYYRSAMAFPISKWSFISSEECLMLRADVVLCVTACYKWCFLFDCVVQNDHLEGINQNEC